MLAACVVVLLLLLQITERYPIDGSVVKNCRRDMRGGKGCVVAASASASATAARHCRQLSCHCRQLRQGTAGSSCSTRTTHLRM